MVPDIAVVTADHELTLLIGLPTEAKELLLAIRTPGLSLGPDLEQVIQIPFWLVLGSIQKASDMCALAAFLTANALAGKATYLADVIRNLGNFHHLHCCWIRDKIYIRE